MKQELTISGKIELTRQELTQIVKDYVAVKHKLNVTRAIYLSDSPNSTKGVVLDVTQASQDQSIPDFPRERKPVKRENKGGSKRVNKGIFPFLREYFEDKRKRGAKTVTFDKLFADVKESFPKIEKRRLTMYLYDHRQLKGTKFKDHVVQL